MGADLYIKSVFEKNFAKYEPQFEFWANQRNVLKKEGKTKEADEAQKKVTELYDKMYERGYFRDSYNRTNLLWVFGLSWWGDVLGILTNDNGMMNLHNAQQFLALLKNHKEDFEVNLQNFELLENETHEEVERYFREKHERLVSFLIEAINLEEDISCSL